MLSRKPVLFLLSFTVFAPIVLYTDRLGSFTNSFGKNELMEDGSTLNFGGDIGKLNALSQESSSILKEPVGVVYLENSGDVLPDSSESKGVVSLESKISEQDLLLRKFGEHKSRVLSATNEGVQLTDSVSEKETLIEQVTNKTHSENDGLQEPQRVSEKEKQGESILSISKQEKVEELDKNGSGQKPEALSDKQEIKTSEPLNANSSVEDDPNESQKTINEGKTDKTVMPDAQVRYLRDQLIRAKVYLGLGSTRNNPHFIRELRVRIREVQRALGDATKDSTLPKNVHEKLKAMERTLAKGKQIQDDCSVVIKKLRAIIHSTEEQLRVHKKQTMFLTQLAAKTLPKGLHCLPLRLSTEYYSLNSSQQQFPNQEKLEDPNLYHYALFSDNILAAAVVVNSTVHHAKDPSKHVFHLVSDRLNYAAMRMWFLANPPGKATIQVQNVDEFTWLNSSYSPVLKQLGSPSMIDYYFRTHRVNSDSNMKFRNPKYLSILNHLRFYLPEIFPKLHKVLFLDDDVVVQKDLSPLWALDLKGKVNGAVETCSESFHRFDRYLNFSNPLIAKNFDPHACGWAYGMNIFDLEEWKKKKITEVYHSWQKLNHDRQLWKLGSLPPGLITFWKQTFVLDRSWHVLGLGYNPTVNSREIERAAVIHYNGNMKPWLEIGMPKYRNYWSKFLNYDQVYLQDCNINP